MTEAHVASNKPAFGTDFSSGMTTVHVAEASVLETAPSVLLIPLVRTHGVPKQYQSELYARLFLASNMATLPGRQLCVAIHLMALGVLSLVVSLSLY